MSEPSPPTRDATLAADGASRPTGDDGRRPGLVGPFTARHLLTILVVVLVGGGLILLVTAPVASPASTTLPNPGASFVPFASATAGLRVGASAPELAADDGGSRLQLTDLDGKPLTLADLRGRPVWLNFFATWCPPCQVETPTLERVYETHRAQGLAVVGISVQESSADDVRAYARTYGLEYPIGFDATSAIYGAYHVYGLPTQVFLDRHGIVRAIVNGPLSEAEAERILAPLLG